MKRKVLGFTLIELLVVIAIIAFIASIALIFIQQARVRSRDKQRASNVKQINTALELFVANHGFYPAVFTGDYFENGDWTCWDCVDTDIQNKPIVDPDTGVELYPSIKEALAPYISSEIKETYERDVPGADESTLADRGYWYTSNGIEYKFGNYLNPEDINNYDPGLVDKTYCELTDTHPTGCVEGQTAVGVWSPGAQGWPR